jgi:DNA-binding MarR family transcriptional regulator
MSGVLMRMEAAGMGERRKAEQDQRRVPVRLAENGEGCFSSMSESMEANNQRLQAGFREEKLQTLLSVAQ